MAYLLDSDLLWLDNPLTRNPWIFGGYVSHIS